MKNLLDRITIDPKIIFAKPIIRGMRYPVKLILDWLASGMTTKEILEDYLDLEEKDIHACLHFAAQLSRTGSVSRTIVAA